MAVNPSFYRGRNPNFRKEVQQEHRTNRMIRIPEVRLVGEGIEPGVYPTEQALAMAEAQGLDLVEISPNAAPPVCRIIDYKKFLYEKKRKEKELQEPFLKKAPWIVDYDKALEYHHKSLKIYVATLGENHPSTATTYSNIGLTYYNKGDYARAIQDFDEAIRLRPDYAKALNARGNAKKQMGDTAGGEADIASAKALAP